MNSKWLPVLVLAASAAVLPSGTAAALVPIPVPPVRLPVAQVGACVLTVADAYGFVSPAEQRRLHNQRVLDLNTNQPGL